MKKVTLLFICIFVVLTAKISAQNLIGNGDFEATDYEVFTYESHSCPSLISGWDEKDQYYSNDFSNVGLDMYNVRAQLLPHEAVADPIKEGNITYLRLQRYEWNGWSDCGLRQTVKNVVPGKTYKFSCLCRMTSDSKGVPAWIDFYENGIDGTKIKRVDLAATYPADENWYQVDETIGLTDAATTLTVYLGVTGGKYYAGSNVNNSNMWVDFDNVSLVDAASVGINAPRLSSIQVLNGDKEITIEGTQNGDNIRIFNVFGVCVEALNATSTGLTIPTTKYEKGLYVVSINNIIKKKIAIK